MATLKKPNGGANVGVVQDFLVANQELIKEKAKSFDKIKELLLEETPKALHGDLDKEYKNEMMYYICEIVSFQTGLDTESILYVLEDMDLNEYLKGV